MKLPNLSKEGLRGVTVILVLVNITVRMCQMVQGLIYCLYNTFDWLFLGHHGQTPQFGVRMHRAGAVGDSLALAGLPPTVSLLSGVVSK